MKKILLLALVLFSFATSKAQVRGYDVEAINNLILDGDSLRNTTQVSSNDTILATKDYVLSVSGSGSGWDSLTFQSSGYIVWWYGGSRIDSVSTSNVYVDLSDTATSGQYYSQYQVDSIVSKAGTQAVYSITLPYASTVAGRIAAATSGTDYPSGWTLAAGSSAIDLDVTHSLGRRVASVTVFAVTGDEEQQLFNTAAYNGILTPDEDNLRIQSLATISKEIVIYIVFAQ